MPRTSSHWTLLAVAALGICAITTSSAGAAPCPHDRCTAGAPMGDPACDDPCAGLVCAPDPYCCRTAWDETCVAEVATMCAPEACARCGDGRVDALEVCDPPGDGATCPGGQVCSFDCRACNSVCGDGVVGPGEGCDPPGSPTGCPVGARCRADCSGCEANETRCGNGLVEQDEVCDPPASSGGCPQRMVCAPSCQACTSCGNGKVDPGEHCDPTSSDHRLPGCPLGGCRADCQGCGLCGDGIVDPGERCDPPGASGGCPGGQTCVAGCAACVTVCGDGVVGPGERCDPPGSAATCPTGEACAFDCNRCTPCGNGTLDPGETCDPPGSSDACPAGQLCSFDCVGCETVCGDGIIGPGETCDPPLSTRGCPAGHACRDDCGACGICGDGVVEPREVCDPPGSTAGCPSGLSCSTDCQQCVAQCGDGVVAEEETCETGTCRAGLVCNGCQFCNTVCGDEVVGPGEVCDPPGANASCLGQLCRIDCSGCGGCGDGVVTAAEVCDPPRSFDGCPVGGRCAPDCATCVATCGDQVVGPGEVCDPPGSDTGCPAGRPCRSGCAGCGVCGDGLIDSPEVCDPPGSTTGCAAGQRCGSSCSCVSQCGDGIRAPFEFCDPPGSSDGCPAGQVCNTGCCGCTTACGDGVVGPGESCDPPGSVGTCPDGRPCDTNCKCPSCPADPTRTHFVTDCSPFSNDQVSCDTAFGAASTFDGSGVSCSYLPTSSGGTCTRCTRAQEFAGFCVNTCNGRVCEADPTRTMFTGGSLVKACRILDHRPADCVRAFEADSFGEAWSCFVDERTGTCNRCGELEEGSGTCVNACAGPASCEADPARSLFAGRGLTACERFGDDEDNCGKAFVLGSNGPISCVYTEAVGSGFCVGCEPGIVDAIGHPCTNTCAAAHCNDPARSRFAGPGSDACRLFDADGVACETAFELDFAGTVSCFYDPGAEECHACGDAQERTDVCTNGCRSCRGEPNRILTGVDGAPTCRLLDSNPTACAQAFQLETNELLASCFFDTAAGQCRDCTTDRASRGKCTNGCATPRCDGDPSRNVFVGRTDVGCSQFDGDRETCERAYQGIQLLPDFPEFIASCYYDAAIGSCRACALDTLCRFCRSPECQLCTNTCRTERPPPLLTSSTTTSSTTSTLSSTTSTSSRSTTSTSTTTRSSTSIPSSSTTVASTTNTTLACDPAACDDHDRCTEDSCIPGNGCAYADIQPTRPTGVTCAVDDLRDILRGDPEGLCPRRCPPSLSRRAEKIGRLIGQGAGARTKRMCTRRLRAAARTARALERRVKRIDGGGHGVPSDAAQRLRSGAAKLRQRAVSLADGFCALR